MASDHRIFELRTYTPVPGKFDLLLARIRELAMGLFEKHGMTNIGYWVATDNEGKSTEILTYIVAHASREAARENWASFHADPAWIAARAEGGGHTASVTSVFLEPTDFSALR
jgi:hypothetical protein